MDGPEEPSVMRRAGRARTSSTAVDRIRNVHGRAITVVAQPCHRRLSLAGFRRKRRRSTFLPNSPMSAGSSVRAAAQASATAIMAPQPIDLNAWIRTSWVPASATTTVSADTNTAWPLEAIASGMASSRGCPRRISSR
jgi:hypothetical protein